MNRWFALLLAVITLQGCHGGSTRLGGDVLVETNLPVQAQALVAEDNVARTMLYNSEYQTVFLVRVEPGTTMRRHMHRFSEETVYLISGEGVLDLGTSKRELAAGDLITVPRYTEHGFTVTGDQPAVVISMFSPPNETAQRIFIDLHGGSTLSNALEEVKK